MKSLLTTFSLLFAFSTSLVAQEVYQETIFPGQTGNQLIQSLINEYSPDVVLNYNNSRDEMYTFVDNIEGYIYCIYTGDVLAISQENPDPRLVTNANGWNAEHIWPQSKGAGTGNARSDLHHLRPARADVNDARGSNPFDYLTESQTIRWWKGNTNQTATPSGDPGEWSRQGSNAFQPWDAEKGNTARAMFYFYLIYSDQADAADPDYFEIQMDVLRSFHNNDQVDQDEVDRTFRAETIQGNVNPFIVDTTLVRRAFFEDFDGNIGESYFVDFETGTKTPAGYAEGTITLSDIQWTFSNTLIGEDGNDLKEGDRSARMRHQTGSSDDPTFIRMDEDKTGGLGTVSFLYGRSNFSNDRSAPAPVIVVEYSTDNGSEWNQAGDPIDLDGVDELTEASREINISDDGRVRIRTISGGDGRRFNIDNFQITGYTDIILPSLSDVTSFDVTQNEISLTASIFSDGNGDVSDRGFLYSAFDINDDPVIDDPDAIVVQSGIGTGTFTETLTGLDSDTEYVIKAYAVNEAGIIYTEEIFVTTLSEPSTDFAFFDDFSGAQDEDYTLSGSIGSSPWTVSRSGADWGARIFNEQLELINSATSASNSVGWIFAYAETEDFSKGYEPVLSENPGKVHWSFNMRQIRSNPAGFGENSYGVAFILGASSSSPAESGSGYAVVLGNSGTPDPVRLVEFTGGIQSLGVGSDALITAGSPLDDPQNNYMSIEVTYEPASNEWQLFGRNDGGSDFADPSEGELTLLGTVTDDTHTEFALPYMGAYWQGSTGNNQTAFFDNVKVDLSDVVFSVTETIEGQEGWRMFASPFSDLSFGELLDPFWTQGFPGSDYAPGNSNIFLFDVTAGTGQFVMPGSASQTSESGEGFLMFVYEKDDYVSGEFPKTWSVSGEPVFDDVDVTLNPNQDGFTLVGNPFDVALDWAEVLGANPDIKPVIYVYDHNFSGPAEGDDIVEASGGYRTWNGTGGSLGSYMIAPFQAFWVESNTENGSLTIPASARASEESPTLYMTEEPSRIKIQAQINGRESAEAWITFGENGSVSSGKYDALALSPLDYGSHMMLAFEDEDRLLATKHLPSELSDAVTLPLISEALKPGDDQSYVQMNGDVKFSWDLEIDPSWSVILHDSHTGESVDMREVNSYSWINDTDKSELSGRSYSMNPRNQKSVNTARFSVLVTPASTSAGPEQDLPAELSLSQNYPNPFNPVTVIRYDLPQQADVSLEVYNMLGQRVSTLVNAPQSAGSHSITFDASRLSSGVYIYRLQVGNNVLTRKMMLVK